MFLLGCKGEPCKGSSIKKAEQVEKSLAKVKLSLFIIITIVSIVSVMLVMFHV